MRAKRRLVMLYFTAKMDLYQKIEDYADARGISFTRAVWELVARGLSMFQHKRGP